MTITGTRLTPTGSLRHGGRFLMVIGDLWQMLASRRQKGTVSGSEGVFGSAALTLDF
jgi:hypothetical protein